MPDTDRLWALLSRLRRLERRELREFRVWMESTRNLIHLTILIIVPLVIAVVTAVSKMNPEFSFLLFPPLASGTHTLFSDPEGRYSSPWKFVGGLTIGALCGWVALLIPATFLFDIGETIGGVTPGGAALAIFLTGVLTWILSAEISAAFSTALLVLLTGTSTRGGMYVLSIAVSSMLVASVFVLWRGKIYEERSRYLYQSTKGDDHVLVPMRGDRKESISEGDGKKSISEDDQPDATAMLGGRLAAAHDAGKVVLLQLIDEDEGVETDEDETESEDERATATHAASLEEKAAMIRTEIGVPCEVLIASEGVMPSRTVMRAVDESNCDLIVTPYETRYGSLSPFLRELFAGDTDVLVHRSYDGRTEWKRVLVPVLRANDLAHAMIDFATRLTRTVDSVSICHCITTERQRRTAEEMLADLAETAGHPCETRVSHSSVESFLGTYAPGYDLVIIGASQDRSAASRFLSPPTFERIEELETDVAIVDRNFPV